MNSQGLPLLINLTFFIVSAGLGASFAALFQANKYIVKGTFDPKYESSYWIRFVLGLIAGLVLSELVPIHSTDPGVSMGKPTIAMLGGFSAALVYRLLFRLVETVESLVRGSASEVIESEQQIAQMTAKEQISGERVAMAAELIKLQDLLVSQDNPELVKEQLSAMLADLAPERMRIGKDA